MARSLIRQLEQILGTVDYDDSVSSVNIAATAEPAVSGTLEDDLNVIRTLVKDAKGTGTWYTDLGNYFDPTSTSGGSNTKSVSLASMAGNTLDSKTILVAVEENNSGAGFAVTGTSSGTLVALTTVYAAPSDRRGLPIFASTANTGSYQDEGLSDSICRVDVLDMDTDSEFRTDAGYVVYAKMHDAADFSGTGDGTDVYMRLYANDSVTDLSTISGTTPSSIKFVYPLRKVLSSMEEYDWARTGFVSSWEGDVELIEDIYNLWSFTGASNDDGSAQPWDNATGNYMLSSNPDNLKGAVDDINDGIGDATYTHEYNITSGESLTDSIEALDEKVQLLEEGGSTSKVVETVSSGILVNGFHDLPGSTTYTPESTAGIEGKNMDVYVGGQLLSADTGVGGANADRDYGETSVSGITFRFAVQEGRNLTYIIRS